MKQWFKDGPGKYVLVSALLFLAAGCNSSGMAEKTFGEFKAEASPVQRAAVSSFMSTQNFSAEDEETLGEIYERGTPEQQEEMESLASINTVHNPEPASMALMGLGLLGLLRRRKKGGDVKALLSILAVVSLLVVGASTASAATFVNGGFEDGNWNGWTTGGGYWWGGAQTPSNYLVGGSSYSAGVFESKSAIVTPGLDPVSGLSRVYGGNYAARVNNGDWDAHVSAISQTVANYTDTNIYFAWAAVLEESHGATDSDHFSLTLKDVTLGDILYSVAYSSATTPGYFNEVYINGDPWGNGYSYGRNWYYSDWQVQNLDVSDRLGHTFELSLMGSDCPYSGHGGYVYLDGFGVAPPVQGEGVVPEPASMILMGMGLVGAAMRRRRK